MKSILIIRLSAIGDVVMASPMIEVMRRYNPDAHLAWLVEPAQASLLEGNIRLDEVIVWPRPRWRQLWCARKYLTLAREVRAFVRQLRQRKFDVAIDCQGLLKSALWAYFSRAPTRIGLHSSEGSRYLMTQVIEQEQDKSRIGSEYFHLMQQLGLNPGVFEMDLALTPEDETFAANFLTAQQLERYAVICPFTTRPQKHWFNDSWIDLCKRIQHQFGLKVVMLGGPADVEKTSILIGEQTSIINVVGQCSLRKSAAIISNADLLVGVDTGLTHMGVAFNIPTIALFGSTRPYTDPVHDNVRILFHDLECAPCGRKPTCDGRFDCMRQLSVYEVVAAIAELNI